MVELFNKGDTTGTFTQCLQKLKNEIDLLSDTQITSTDIDELKQYYYAKHMVEPIIIYLENLTQELNNVKVKRYNHFRFHDESEYIYIDGYRISFIIPYDGDPSLLYIRATTFLLTSFVVDDVKRPTNNQLGTIRFSLEYTHQELEGKNNIKDYISEMFKKEFDPYIKAIQYVNADTEKFNNNLQSRINDYLQNRLKKAQDFISLGEKLNIQLKPSDTAPNTIPIILKPKIKIPPAMPSQKPVQNDFEISDADYQNIKNIINLACISMERAAVTFKKLSEEELRDILLSNLNTHYQGTATGETFSKVGKTDIRIEFKNKSAYIGECKIWHGPTRFNDALLQLFSYATWRDSKTSLIIFNKDNKDFGNVVDSINKCLQDSSMCNARLRLQKNEWQCRFYKEPNSSDQIAIHIVAYDLYL